ncbi:MAG: Ldh family oxidoreductase [Gammaproteobacteria bacterium]|jgi:delta1-piperideine-2-carboxylate reductase|tara:strand:+ start:307 stop:1308 length:1002 start_codon:yes stop_codon:yes gene_type:complete
MPSKTININLDEIFSLAKAALIKHGANEENADAVAKTVTNAERDGSISHGLFRIPGYIKALQSKKVDGSAKPEIEEVTPVILRCDAKNGFAPLAHQYGIKKLIEAAQKFGIAGLAIQRCHHFAALWPEVEQISEQGLVGLTSVSYMPGVAPSGGATALFGTNPIAFSWPRPGNNPIVFDMATASMAKGEIQIAARDGHSVPLGTGLSASGELTTDASEIDKGVLLPFGGHKGSVIALMVELLSGPLVGETFSYETKERDNGDGGPAQGGQFILAMSPSILSGKDTSEQTEQFLKQYNNIDGTRLPGARRHENRKDTGPRKVNLELINTIKGLT